MTVKENTKCRKIVTRNIQKIQETMKRPNPRIRRIDREDSQCKGPGNNFTRVIEENFLNLKKQVAVNE